MIVTLYEYEEVSHSQYKYKICIKKEKSNLIFQTDHYSELYFFVNKYEIPYLVCDKKSTKKHYNYYGELECTQTIHVIKER